MYTYILLKYHPVNPFLTVALIFQYRRNPKDQYSYTTPPTRNTQVKSEALSLGQKAT